MPGAGDAGVDVDELFDAIEDALDARTVPGIPQDVLADEDDVPGRSFADTLQDLADAHAAAYPDGACADPWPPRAVEFLSEQDRLRRALCEAWREAHAAHQQAEKEAAADAPAVADVLPAPVADRSAPATPCGPTSPGSAPTWRPRTPTTLTSVPPCRSRLRRRGPGGVQRGRRRRRPASSLLRAMTTAGTTRTWLRPPGPASTPSTPKPPSYAPPPLESDQAPRPRPQTPSQPLRLRRVRPAGSGTPFAELARILQSTPRAAPSASACIRRPEPHPPILAAEPLRRPRRAH